MHEYTLQELLELDVKGAKELVQNYYGPDKAKFAKRVSCVVSCHKPVDDKIGLYVKLLGDHFEMEKEYNRGSKLGSVKENAEKILHLYLPSDETFPTSRDYFAVACLYIASEITPKFKINQEEIAEILSKTEESILLEDSISNYSRKIIKNLLSKYTDVENVDNLLKGNDPPRRHLVLQLVGEVVNHYNEFVVKPCTDSEFKKLDASEYNKKFEVIQSVKDAKKELPEKIRSEVLNEEYRIKKEYTKFFRLYDFLKKPDLEVPQNEVKEAFREKFEKLKDLDLIEFDNDKKAYRVKDFNVLKNIRLINSPTR